MVRLRHWLEEEEAEDSDSTSRDFLKIMLTALSNPLTSPLF